MQNAKFSEEIDFVLTWVDGNDPEWIAEKQKYSGKTSYGNSAIRFRDWENLHFWFRGVEKFAPWVRKIHLITCGHFPKWLNREHPKLHLVRHEDYIPRECLPTFSANPIEIFIHRIPTLAEKFVLFNDDMFLTNNVKPTDFFTRGLPNDQAILNAFIPLNAFSDMDFNNIKAINRNFHFKTAFRKNLSKWFSPSYGPDSFYGLVNLMFLFWNGVSRFRSAHLPISYLKETFQKVWAAEPEQLWQTGLSKFRASSDLTQWVFRYWQLMEGKFHPARTIGKMFNFVKDPAKNFAIYDAIRNQKFKIVCTNEFDDQIDFELEKSRLTQAFEAILPQKSAFEK